MKLFPSVSLIVILLGQLTLGLCPIAAAQTPLASVRAPGEGTQFMLVREKKEIALVVENGQRVRRCVLSEEVTRHIQRPDDLTLTLQRVRGTLVVILRERGQAWRVMLDANGKVVTQKGKRHETLSTGVPGRVREQHQHRQEREAHQREARRPRG